MEVALAYALNSFPVIVSVVELPAESNTFLNLTVEAWTILLGFSSSITAVVALCFSVWQARATRRHNMLMVRPHLDHVHVQNNNDGIYIFELRNDGVGPAILKSAQFYVDDQPVDTHEDQVQDAIRALFPGIPDERFGHQSIGMNSYIAVGQVIPLITIHTVARRKAEDIRNAVVQRAYVLARYESIYGEPFTYDSRQ